MKLFTKFAVSLVLAASVFAFTACSEGDNTKAIQFLWGEKAGYNLAIESDGTTYVYEEMVSPEEVQEEWGYSFPYGLILLEKLYDSELKYFPNKKLYMSAKVQDGRVFFSREETAQCNIEITGKGFSYENTYGVEITYIIFEYNGKTYGVELEDLGGAAFIDDAEYSFSFSAYYTPDSTVLPLSGAYKDIFKTFGKVEMEGVTYLLVEYVGD